MTSPFWNKLEVEGLVATSPKSTHSCLAADVFWYSFGWIVRWNTYPHRLDAFERCYDSPSVTRFPSGGAYLFSPKIGEISGICGSALTIVFVEDQRFNFCSPLRFIMENQWLVGPGRGPRPPFSLWWFRPFLVTQVPERQTFKALIQPASLFRLWIKFQIYFC